MTDREEIVAKLTAYVSARYGGRWESAWADYCDPDGEVGLPGVTLLMKDAGIGSGWTRGMIAREVMRVMDGNKNGKISLDEFRAILEGK